MPTSDLVSTELSLQDGIGTASGHGVLRVADIVLAHIFLTGGGGDHSFPSCAALYDESIIRHLVRTAFLFLGDKRRVQ